MIDCKGCGYGMDNRYLNVLSRYFFHLKIHGLIENILLRSLMMGYGWNESWLGECLHLPPAPLISCFWPRRRIHEQVAAAEEEGEESFSSKSSRSSSSVGVCTYRLPSAFFDCALRAMKCASLGHWSQTSIQTHNGWCIVAKWTPMIFSQIFC